MQDCNIRMFKLLLLLLLLAGTACARALTPPRCCTYAQGTRTLRGA
jgi:hypothetical protein